ncbi:MAG: hypothetical protein KDK62_05485 [Chlamydiia bacterium]|nr:hypothetical protein [Chlamydiia bacterium]
MIYSVQTPSNFNDFFDPAKLSALNPKSMSYEEAQKDSFNFNWKMVALGVALIAVAVIATIGFLVLLSPPGLALLVAATAGASALVLHGVAMSITLVYSVVAGSAFLGGATLVFKSMGFNYGVRRQSYPAAESFLLDHFFISPLDENQWPPTNIEAVRVYYKGPKAGTSQIYLR